MNKLFAIGIPTLNRLDLLVQAIRVYAVQFPFTMIYVVDNGQQNIKDVINYPNLVIFEQKENLGVAQSWNVLCKAIFEHNEYALILNDDIILDGNDVKYQKIIKDRQKPVYFDVCPLSWCAFIISKQCYQEVGRFDKAFFPAYFEDNDYAYRMKLLGKGIYHNMDIMPQVYRQSQTMEKDKTVRTNYKKNQDLYKRKWGGLPNFETYKIPFNTTFELCQAQEESPKKSS